MMPTPVAMGLVLAILGALMCAVGVAQRRWAWHPEVARKLVHVVMGLVCLSFPWLFRDIWPVWALAALAALMLGSVRFVPALKARLGGVLGGVERESWGELVFPLAVAFLFALARGDAVLFCVPVMILTLADMMAAVIGRRYGFARYETDEGWKSVEGSAAFFIVAFLAAHLTLLLGSNAGRWECVLIAAVMGLILTLMEAIAWRGLDNLFVPLASYVCLVRMLELTPLELGVRAAVLAGLVACLCWWRRTTRLTQSAVIGAALVLYVAWAVGGVHWLTAPLATAMVYSLLCRRLASAPQRHTIHAIAAVGGVGLFWLCLSQVIGTVNTIYAYGVGYSANLGLIALASFADGKQGRALFAAVVKAVALGYVALAIPYLVVWRHNANLWPLTAWAFAILVSAVGAFALWQPSLRCCPADPPRWLRQGTIAALASAMAFGIITYLEPWSKTIE
ncbi:MAG: hypothetical protein WCV00_14630 [Verrucomicrobiia bacterium]|jgi:phytol kinase